MQYPTFGSCARKIYENGYWPTAIRPGGKRPGHNGWQRIEESVRQSWWTSENGVSVWKAVYDPDEFHPYWPVENPLLDLLDDVKCETWGIGLLLGDLEWNLLQVDCDFLSGEFADLFEGEALKLLPQLNNAIRIVGNAPKRSFIVRGDDSARIRDRILSKTMMHGLHENTLELRGRGLQQMVYGVHPDTGMPYMHGDLHPLNTCVFELPELDMDDLNELLHLFNEMAVRFDLKPAGPKQGVKKKGKGESNCKTKSINSTGTGPSPIEGGMDFTCDLVERLGMGLASDEIANAGYEWIAENGDVLFGPSHPHKWTARNLVKLWSSIPIHYYGDYAYWFALSQACKNLICNDSGQLSLMQSLWDCICIEGLNYDYGDNFRRWEKMKWRGRVFSMGTIVSIAEANGHYFVSPCKLELRRESIHLFFEDCIVCDSNGLIHVDDLFNAYNEWNDGSHPSTNAKALGRVAKQMGGIGGRESSKARRRYYSGLAFSPFPN